MSILYCYLVGASLVDGWSVFSVEDCAMPSRPQSYGVDLKVKERCLNKEVNGDESDEDAYWERFPILQVRDDRLLSQRRDIAYTTSGPWRRTVSVPTLQFPQIVTWSRYSSVQPYRRCVSAHRLRRPMFK